MTLPPDVQATEDDSKSVEYTTLHDDVQRRSSMLSGKTKLYYEDSAGIILQRLRGVTTDEEAELLKTGLEELWNVSNQQQQQQQQEQEQQPRRGRNGARAVANPQPLLDWFNAHLDDPYPTKEEKSELAAQVGQTFDQVNNWFINRRIRSQRQHKRSKR